MDLHRPRRLGFHTNTTLHAHFPPSWVVSGLTHSSTLQRGLCAPRTRPPDRSVGWPLRVCERGFLAHTVSPHTRLTFPSYTPPRVSGHRNPRRRAHVPACTHSQRTCFPPQRRHPGLLSGAKATSPGRPRGKPAPRAGLRGGCGPNIAEWGK